MGGRAGGSEEREPSLVARRSARPAQVRRRKTRARAHPFNRRHPPTRLENRELAPLAPRWMLRASTTNHLLLRLIRQPRSLFAFSVPLWWSASTSTPRDHPPLQSARAMSSAQRLRVLARQFVGESVIESARYCCGDKEESSSAERLRLRTGQSRHRRLLLLIILRPRALPPHPSLISPQQATLMKTRPRP